MLGKIVTVFAVVIVMAVGFVVAGETGLLEKAGISVPALAAPVPHPNVRLPRMALEGQFNGPIQDTLIQRWRDPIDGTVCYIYMPVTVQHEPTPTGFVGYGANTIGSITCLPSGKVAVNALAKTPDVLSDSSSKTEDAKPDLSKKSERRDGLRR